MLATANKNSFLGFMAFSSTKSLFYSQKFIKWCKPVIPAPLKSVLGSFY